MSTVTASVTGAEPQLSPAPPAGASVTPRSVVGDLWQALTPLQRGTFVALSSERAALRARLTDPRRRAPWARHVLAMDDECHRTATSSAVEPPVVVHERRGGLVMLVPHPLGLIALRADDRLPGRETGAAVTAALTAGNRMVVLLDESTPSQIMDYLERFTACLPDGVLAVASRHSPSPSPCDENPDAVMSLPDPDVPGTADLDAFRRWDKVPFRGELGMPKGVHP
ncbi:hypothetical protein ABID70_000947 [Clavibacter michiganensis]|uniref:hypothetical protein n=1 Tax=Clavibacter michiganensis TaxID=28447 RepID=UPI001AE1294E|nr:hypothetical protein [Clavibacter michiganensis]MBP2458388.1 hypothetical protein [Clavibacter michiganensis]MDQ0410959.1 hypothetical protein [Clavibacter michiganensis]